GRAAGGASGAHGAAGGPGRGTCQAGHHQHERGRRHRGSPRAAGALSPRRLDDRGRADFAGGPQPGGGGRGERPLRLSPRQGAARSADRTDAVTASLSDTAERMAMLPADIPRDAVIVTRHLQRDYDMGGEVVHALRGVDLVIRQNEFVAIMGPWGSGKSTLMNLIGCLDSPTEGEYWLNGHRVSGLGDDELARIRNKGIGFVFQ